MLIAISGSQGSGKSTVLNEMKQHYNVVSRKTSRSILSDWDVTLQEVNSDPALTIKFQEEIIARKLKDESEAAISKDVWFTERTFSDLFTYALVSLGKDNTYSQWLDEYYKKCALYNKIYNHVFYLRAGLFQVEHDGVRGSNKHYSRMVDITMLDLTEQMIENGRLHLVDTPDLSERAAQILKVTHLV